MGKKLSYLLIGNYGDCNIGDELLLKEVVREVLIEHHEVNFYVPVRNRGFVSLYHQELKDILIPVEIKNFGSVGKSFLKCKKIIIGGGGIWSGYTGRLAHFVPLIVILGKIFRKNVGFLSVGFYSTASSFDKIFVNIGIMLADYCSVRDKESFETLWKINKSKSKIVEDLSLQYLTQWDENPSTIMPEMQEHKIMRHQKKQGKLIIGISLKPLYDGYTNAKITNEFATAMNSLNSIFDNSLFFVFFPFAKTRSQVESDESLVENLLDRLNDKKNVLVLGHTNPVYWYVAMKELVDIFIGMRYHSIIFAYMANKPVLCIPYENKITEFLNAKSGEYTKFSIMKTGEVSSAKIIEFVRCESKKA